MNRVEFLSRAQSETFDIVIVGGGATGLGAAVDAAAPGYSVCLIEQSDFTKGTSSRNTKLIHGGVRYLKQGRISLVMDALRERERLLRNAPHLLLSGNSNRPAFMLPPSSSSEAIHLTARDIPAPLHLPKRAQV